ncbi:MAG: flagellar biosynthesis anti-sigma factor FlgM [Desulfobulbus sp.]|jgi:negative regulator of flagellin synthesis FlgM|uniref:flagellar biosynthesis anti-sigma factor FlgM n=1 Tax=Desulfobulbus sp. TaxID=895 RepID=UPI00284D58BB|nr:flagellar biosynthesis anti-sigma factor FlgM [Desulfobulbus sp.]MDR2550743.1 flagellar biosynthesis anti-sigma factor FlgM [Desulfobulbus sp.]
MGQIGGLNRIGQAGDTQKTGKSESKEGVSFASALQGASMTQETGRTGDAERAARVQELKTQVASGQYEPDLNKVASSLLRFLVEG